MEQQSFAELLRPFASLLPGQEERQASICVVGQIVVKRVLGKRLAFLDIQNALDESIIQLRLLQSVFSEDGDRSLSLVSLCKQLKVGDCITVEGFPERTMSGCLSVTVRSVEVTEKWQGDPLECAFTPRRRGPDASKNGTYVSFMTSATPHDEISEGKPIPLCKLVRKGLSHTTGGRPCPYRHHFMDEAEKKLVEHYQNEKIKRRALLHDPGDPFVDKMPKSARARVFADWLLETYGRAFLCSGKGVVDVAGGKGFLSYELAVRGVKTTLIEPRMAHLSKRQWKHLKKTSTPAFKQIQACFDEEFWTAHFDQDAHDSRAVKRGVCTESIEYGREVVLGCSLIIGLHPDQATEYIVKFALDNNKALAVVPCCVFPQLFERHTADGHQVILYDQLITYYTERHSTIRLDYLKMEGRNKVIYTTPAGEAVPG